MSKARPKTKPATRTSGGAKAQAKGSGGKNRLPKEKKPSAKEAGSKIARLIDRKQNELLTADRQRSTAATDWVYAHAHAAELKKYLDKKQAEVNQIISEIRNIRTGNYTPSLFNEAGESQNGHAETNGHAEATANPAVDEGARQPLSTLLDFKHPKTGKPHITAGKINLVKDVVGSTVGDLEKFQRENAFDWVQKIKGLGSSSDALNDAHAAFRKKFPMPDPVLTQSEKATGGKAEKGPEETSLQKAEKLGAEAGLAGDNGKPLPEWIKQGSPEHVAWVKGFESASKGSLGPAAPTAAPTTERLEKAYALGCDEALKEVKSGYKVKNPFAEKSPEHEAWKKGFDDTNAPGNASVRNRMRAAGAKTGPEGQIAAGEGGGEESPR